MPAETAAAHATILAGDFGHAIMQTNCRGTVAQASADYTLIFKIGGVDALFNCAGKPVTLDSHSCILLNPWSLYARQDNCPGPPSVLLSLRIDARWLKSRLPPLDIAGRLFRLHQAHLTPDFRASCDQLSRMVSNPGMASHENAVQTVLTLVAEAACAAAQGLSTAVVPPADASIQRAMRFVQDNIGTPLRMDEIARVAGLSRTNLFKHFRHCLGIAPQQYIDGIRMDMAPRMLANANKPITQVSDALGFSAATHFARFFIRHTGLRPLEFRRCTTTLQASRQR